MKNYGKCEIFKTAVFKKKQKRKREAAVKSDMLLFITGDFYELIIMLVSPWQFTFLCCLPSAGTTVKNRNPLSISGWPEENSATSRSVFPLRLPGLRAAAF